MEETGTDLIEVVEEVPEGIEEDLGTEQRKEDDLRSKPLTEKMIYLMQKTAEYGYLTRLEVELIYANQTHAYKVLGTLREKGLIADFETEKQPKKAVYLKPKGYRTLEKFGRLRLKRRFLPQHFKPFIFTHRMACARVGLVLDSHPLVREFMPESLLWERQVERRQKLCDGEFLYQWPGAEPEKVGLEVELTLKNRDKLDESLRQLKQRLDLDQVWWICGDGAILRALQSEVRRGFRNERPRHVFCLLDDFQNTKHRARLADADGVEFSVDPAEPTLRPLPARPAEPPRATAPATAAPDSRELVARSPHDLQREFEEAQLALRRAEDQARREREAARRERRENLLFRAKIAAVIAGLISLCVAGRMAWTAIQDFLAGTAPAQPVPAWRTRRVSPPHFILDGWIVDSKSLRSHGDRFRFKVEFIQYLHDSRICGVTVYDSSGRALRQVSLDGLGYGHFDGELEFRAPPRLGRFGIGLWDGSYPFSCLRSTRPEFWFELK